MAVKLVLSSQKILDKVFSKVPRGYNANEVDAFLDIIMQDYVTIEANMLVSFQDYQEKINHIKQLTEENRNLKLELSKYQQRFKNIKEGDNVTSDNIDILKKLNAYENYLWKLGINPNNIK